MYRAWMRLTREAWSLNCEAAAVVTLRASMFAVAAPGARKEFDRMVLEKAAAALVLQARALNGALGLSPVDVSRHAIAYCRRKVRANRRRLLGRV